MIVILNSVYFPVIPKLIRQLADRYQTGAALDAHQLKARERAGLFQQICQWTVSMKQENRQDLVIAYTFRVGSARETPSRLRGSSHQKQGRCPVSIQFPAFAKDLLCAATAARASIQVMVFSLPWLI